LQFSLQEASPESFGYTLIFRELRRTKGVRIAQSVQGLGYGLDDRGSIFAIASGPDRFLPYPLDLSFTVIVSFDAV
jgi:hypothetical protein